MSNAIRRAATANRRLTEFKQASSHHIVSASVHDRGAAEQLAVAHGSRLVTGTKRHFVAHFDDKSKSHAFHTALKATGHADAKHGTVRESIADSARLAK